MSLNLLKIQSLFMNSDLNDEEQNEFLHFLSGASDEELSELASFLAENPQWIRKLYQNFQVKRGIGLLGNEKSWQSILDHEEDELKQLA